MSSFHLGFYFLVAFMVKHSEQTERKFEINITFTGYSWSDQYKSNQTAIDSLLRGPLQPVNSGIKKELEDAFKGQPDFVRYHNLSNPKLWNDQGKVGTTYLELVFGDAVLNSSDPLVTLLQILKDGKLGALSVDNKNVVLTEKVSGYNLGSWVGISGACSFNCCLRDEVITQNRTCRSKTAKTCLGVLLKRKLRCVDFCSCRADAAGQNSSSSVINIAPGPSSATSMAPSPTVTVGTTSPPSTTKPTDQTSPTTSTMKPTCALIAFEADLSWNSSFGDTSSDVYKMGAKIVSMALKSVFNDSQKYDNVDVSEVKFSEKSGKTRMAAKLCLVVKGSDGKLIEDVLTDKVNTGSFHESFKVKSGSAEFKPAGVSFKDWKAKAGECKKCDGAGGEFVIVGTCEVKTTGMSCKGLKNTKMTKDCVSYCPESSAVATTVSYLVLAIGILFSISSP